MFKKIAKKAVAVIMIVTCVAGMAFGSSAAMSNHYQTVSYSSGSGGVDTSSYTKTQGTTKNSTRPAGVGFNGLAPGAFPAGVKIKFRTLYNGYDIANATYHSQSDYNNGTIKHGSYTGSYGNMTGISVKMRVYDTSGSYGNTLQARWNFGSTSSL
ncbi:hypothetical protein SAMN02910456_01376 [Ruminococcaceae bacterium YRB3002]|nr:hypothetical protein SAMN02910456_01376 [Ruminococcaceae bacterium YRB3002]